MRTLVRLVACSWRYDLREWEAVQIAVTLGGYIEVSAAEAPYLHNLPPDSATGLLGDS